VPKGASVTIDGQAYGTTPLTAKLKRANSHVVTIEMAGYQPFDTIIISDVNTLYLLLDVAAATLISGVQVSSSRLPQPFYVYLLVAASYTVPILGFDILSGDYYTLSPSRIAVTLIKEENQGFLKPDSVQGTVVLKPDSSWQGNTNRSQVR
jgi:hypothetical protein